MAFYAVASGRQIGIYPTWSQCEAQIKGFPQAKFKKFKSLEEAESFVGDAKPCGNQDISIPRSSLTKPFDNPVPSNPKRPALYYAVAKGKKVGIYSTWPECKAQVDGQEFPIFKKFDNLEEAEQFVHNRRSKGRSSTRPLARASIPAVNVTTVRDLSKVIYNDHPFHCDDKGFVHVYTDGSCEGNGKSKAKAGIGVWFGIDHPLNVGDPVEGPPTNNVAEIEAATKAIKVAKSCGVRKLQINTDSQFLIRCITEWAPKWRQNNWKLSSGGDVKNKIQLQSLHSVYDDIDVKWNYVQAHKGIEGNEHADTLAKMGASKFQRKENVRYKPY